MDLNITQLKDKAVKRLDTFLCNYLLSKTNKNHKKAALLSYWILDFIRLLTKEDQAASSVTKYRRYERGSVIQVHLGYRIGNEEGGLHYAVVLNNMDSVKSSILTIVPLTSIKSNDKPINPVNVNLGFEIIETIKEKILKERDNITREQKEWEKQLGLSTMRIDPKKLSKTIDKTDNLHQKLDKIKKMKFGSIALVNQITTISKLRIYDPCSSKDLLYGIKLSDKLMTALDKKIQKLYIKNID